MTIFLTMIIFLAVAVYLYRYMPMPAYAWLRKQMVRAMRWNAGLSYRSVRVGAHDWPYLEAGNADAPVMLFVHGFGAHKDNAIFFAPHMVRAGYRVIAPDQVGFGDNAPDESVPYDMKSQAARLVAFLDALGIGAVHIVGSSMGGWIALYVALEWRSRVVTLTLMNNAGVRGRETSELEEMPRDGPNPLIASDEESVRGLMSFVMYKPPFVPGNFLAIEGAERAERVPLFEMIFDQLISEYDSALMNDRLGEVAVPTLIVWGRHDRVLHVSCTDVMRTAIPNAEVVIMDDVGHIPIIEKPREFAGILCSFLARHGGG